MVSKIKNTHRPIFPRQQKTTFATQQNSADLEKQEYRKLYESLAEQHQQFADKALLSLSSGALILTVTFVHNVCGDRLILQELLFIAWACWGCCILAIVLNSALTSAHYDEAIDNIDENKDPLDTKYAPSIPWITKLSHFLFFIASVSFFTFAIINTCS